MLYHIYNDSKNVSHSVYKCSLKVTGYKSYYMCTISIIGPKYLYVSL